MWKFIQDVFKEYLKTAIFGSLSLIASVTWAFFGFPFPKNDEERSQLVAALFGWLIDSSYQHPVIMGVAAIVLVATLLAIYLVRRTKSQKSSDLETILKEIGIEGLWPHGRFSPTAEGGASWKQMCEDISRRDNSFVFILGANGIDTFGGKHSPLYDAIGTFTKEMKVVLLAPGSPEMESPASAVNLPPKVYRGYITKSRKRLSALKKQGRHIEMKYYDGRPNWKMIITNERSWIQYYESGSNVSDCPVFVFFNSQSPYNFYSIFYTEFMRIWARCGDPVSLA